MMRFKLAIAAILFGAMSLSGCATALRGDQTAWRVNTIPPGASVSTDNGQACEPTPCSILMPRRAEFTATISEDGYQAQQINVVHRISTAGGVAFAGNILLSAAFGVGLIGAGVDVPIAVVSAVPDR